MEYHIVESINRHIHKNIKGLRVTGSYKRKDPVISELEYICKRDLQDIVNEFNNIYGIEEIINTPRFVKFSFITDFGDIVINIWRAGDNYEYFYKCLIHDLHKDKIEKLKDMALKQNFYLDDNGFKNTIGQLLGIVNRKCLYKIIKYTPSL